MTEARLEVLPKRKDVASHGAQIPHRLEQFLLGLAQSEHDSGLGINSPLATFLHLSQNGE